MTDALERWLALEHEAVWLYSFLGGRFDHVRDEAFESWEEHRVVRDRLSASIAAKGQSPVGPAMTYGSPISTLPAGRAAVRDVEDRIAAVCLSLVGEAAHQSFVLKQLRRAARARIAWGGRPQAFPGLD